MVIGRPPARRLSNTFNEGVALSRPVTLDEAIAKFNEALDQPEVLRLLLQHRRRQAGKKDYAGGSGYNKAIEQNANSADAYNGLAQVLTQQKKSEEAPPQEGRGTVAASAPAGGGNADAMVNQGKIFINAGNMADAKAQFQKAVAADPNHADAHFYLGNAWVGEGNFGEAVKEFETYLKLAPSGPNAKQAQDAVTALKPLVK